MDKKELWHEMLTTYCNRMHYRGLTLPNIIGAYYYYYQSNHKDYDLSSRKCVFRVLDDITNSLKDTGVLIRYCGHIRKYVLSSLKDKNMQHPKLNDRIFKCTIYICKRILLVWKILQNIYIRFIRKKLQRRISR